MRQTEIENMLKDHELRIKELENSNFVGVDLANEEKLIELGVRPAVGQIEKVSGELLKEIDIQEKQKVYSRDGESGTTVEKPIPDNPQENNDQSVELKGLPITKEGVSTTESGDGKSPVDIKIKKVKNE